MKSASQRFCRDCMHLRDREVCARPWPKKRRGKRDLVSGKMIPPPVRPTSSAKAERDSRLPQSCGKIARFWERKPPPVSKVESRHREMIPHDLSEHPDLVANLEGGFRKPHLLSDELSRRRARWLPQIYGTRIAN